MIKFELCVGLLTVSYPLGNSKGDTHIGKIKLYGGVILIENDKQSY